MDTNKQKFDALYKAIVDVRKAQKKYFWLKKHHVDSKQQLEECKALEAKLDKILKTEEEERTRIQTMLFQ